MMWDWERLANKLAELKHSTNSGGEECRYIYNQLLEVNGGDVEATELLVFKKLGSGEAAGYIMGHADEDCGSCLEVFSKRYFCLCYRIAHCTSVVWLFGVAKMLAKSSLYFIDIVTDIKLIVLLHSVGNSSTEEFMYVLVACLLTSEVVKMRQLWTQPDIQGLKKNLKFRLFPILPIVTFVSPAVIHYLELKLEATIHSLLARSQRDHRQERALRNAMKKLNNVRIFKGEMRATENVLEHFPQLCITLTILFDAFGSRVLPLGMDGIKEKLFGLKPSSENSMLINNAQYAFLYFSLFLSFSSIVRGQVNLIVTQLNGQPGFMAKVVLILYVALSLLARPTVIAIFGVFAIPFPWNFIVIGVVLLPQLLASFLLQTKLYKSKGSRFRRALWSLLTTPLFLTWDYVYRQKNFEKPIDDCWWGAKWAFLFDIALAWIGDLLLIPIITFMLFFVTLFSDSSLNEVEFVTILATPALGMTLLIALVLALGFLYMRKLHPWSRVLNAELSKHKTSMWHEATDIILLLCCPFALPILFCIRRNNLSKELKENGTCCQNEKAMQRSKSWPIGLFMFLDTTISSNDKFSSLKTYSRSRRRQSLPFV